MPFLFDDDSGKFGNPKMSDRCRTHDLLIVSSDALSFVDFTNFFYDFLIKKMPSVFPCSSCYLDRLHPNFVL